MTKITKIKLTEPLWMVITKAAFSLTLLIFAIMGFLTALTPIAQIILGVFALILAILLIVSIFIKKTSK